MQDVANQNKLMILPLPAFQDNYIWTLRADQHCIVVDPGDASVVLWSLQESFATSLARGYVVTRLVVWSYI